MNHKDKIKGLLRECALEVLAFVKERESAHQDRWVPTVEVKDSLALNFVAVPRASKQYGEKGWLFAILARMLEDSGELEYKKEGSRSFCRNTKP
jgi:hypothetical protein